VATIPVGIVGLALEHSFRVLFAKPEAAAIFLTINGGILILGERYWRRERARTAALAAGAPAAATAAGARMPPAARPAPVPAAAPAGPAAPPEIGAPDAAATETAAVPEAPVARERAADDRAVSPDAQRRLAGIGLVSALWIGASQVLALLAGISREGVTMVGGLSRGLSHEDAMRFSFLLSTPVILAAGLLKLPDLAGPLGNGIRGPVVAGSVAAAAASAVAVVFLARYFRTRTLTPFAIYCLAAGLISIIRFTVW
jgi:undecaprenyl-diphosphatase